MIQKLFTYVAAAAAVTALTACGGGGEIYLEGGGGHYAQPPPTVTLVVSSQNVGVYPNEPVNVSVSASGYVRSVQFYSLNPVNRAPELLFELRSPPFAGTVLAPPGRASFDLYAVAFDEYGEEIVTPVTSVPVRR